jgi:hypothetical protein
MLRDVGSSRVLQTSYVWLLFVPLAARALASVKENLALKIFGEVFHVTFELPFSWKIFYFAAICFSVAGITYTWRCPAIVKRYKAFPAFQEERRGTPYLRSLLRLLPESIQQDVKTLLDEYDDRVDHRSGAMTVKTKERDPDKLAQAYWMLHQAANHSDLASLVVCFLFYAAGFILLSVVFVQNFIFVVRATL